ncbi:MAG: hypothetical protein Fur0037_01500 [Planctomycetota bacterium]
MRTSTLDHDEILEHLLSMQEAIAGALIEHMRTAPAGGWSAQIRDEEGDTVFGLDAVVEDVLLAHCREWGEHRRFTLLAEGIDARGMVFGSKGAGGVPFRLLVDPIDGTRNLMFDKRSAWCLMGAAPDRGPRTRLSDVEVAVMTELPTTRMAVRDRLWAIRGRGARADRRNLYTGEDAPLSVSPSRARTLRWGFATVDNFFRGGKELLARIEEDLLERALGPWNPEKADVYCDHYISSGGQLAELALGRDRFVLDLRPLVHAALGATSSLCARPYDLCTVRIAQEAGCVVESVDGSPLDAPFDVGTNVAFAAYANEDLARELRPIVRDVVEKHLGRGAA